MGYFGGFLVTLRQHGYKNKVTTQYSGGRVFRRKNDDKKDQKIEKPERMHGRHVLNRGDHRDEAVRVLVHQPSGRDLHEGRTSRG